MWKRPIRPIWNPRRAAYLNDRLLKDMEFHIALAAISGWKVHLRTLQNLYDLLYLKYRGNYMSARPAEFVHQEHREIFEAGQITRRGSRLCGDVESSGQRQAGGPG